MKVAGTQRPLSEGKGKQSVNQSSNGKHKAASPVRHADGIHVKKQRGRTAGAHNYSSEDLDSLFDILEECLSLGGHAWNSVGDEFSTWCAFHVELARIRSAAGRRATGPAFSVLTAFLSTGSTSGSES